MVCYVMEKKTKHMPFFCVFYELQKDFVKVMHASNT